LRKARLVQPTVEKLLELVRTVLVGMFGEDAPLCGLAELSRATRTQRT
jgi:hypothetical protein